MNIRSDLTLKVIDVNKPSTGVAFYILPEENLTEQELWEEKETLCETAKMETTTRTLG